MIGVITSIIETEYVYTQFDCVVKCSPLENMQLNLDSSTFGMGETDTFGMLKMALSRTLGVLSEKFVLIWNDVELKDEETPNYLGMEAVVWKTEILELHFNSNHIES